MACGLFLAVALIAHLAASRFRWLAWAGCMCVLGAAVAEWKRPGPAPLLDADPGETLVVSGCVVEPLSIRDGRGRFAVEIAEGARTTVSFRADDQAPLLPYGTIVEFLRGSAFRRTTAIPARSTMQAIWLAGTRTGHRPCCHEPRSTSLDMAAGLRSKA